MKKTLLAGAFLLSLWAPSRAQERSISQTLLVPPPGGAQWPYYLYFPASQSVHTHLLVIPNNAGSLDKEPEQAQREAYDKVLHSQLLAEQLGCPLLVPTFPRTDKVYATSLSRETLLLKEGKLVRPDLQLTAMIEDARLRLRERGWALAPKVLMYGFSADAMFTNRYSFLHPEQVEAAAIGSPGGWPLAPVPEISGAALRYPIGISDLGKLVGKGVNFEELRQVDFFFFLGDKDDNDSVPYRDGYTAEDQALVFRLFGKTPVERWPLAEKLYSQAGLHCSFHLYPGVGHSTNEAGRQDILRFLQAHVDGPGVKSKLELR